MTLGAETTQADRRTRLYANTTHKSQRSVSKPALEKRVEPVFQPPALLAVSNLK